MLISTPLLTTIFLKAIAVTVPFIRLHSLVTLLNQFVLNFLESRIFYNRFAAASRLTLSLSIPEACVSAAFPAEGSSTLSCTALLIFSSPHLTEKVC